MTGIYTALTRDVGFPWAAGEATLASEFDPDAWLADCCIWAIAFSFSSAFFRLFIAIHFNRLQTTQSGVLHSFQ